jgi:hypothetical protein
MSVTKYQIKNRSLKYRSLAFLLVALSSLQVKAAPFDDFKFANRGRWDFNFETNYGSTDGNYDKSGGSFSKLLNSGSFKTLDFDLGVRAGLFQQISLYGATRVSANSASTDTFGVNPSTSSTGLGFFLLGADWQMLSGSTILVTDLNFKFPNSKIDRTSTNTPPVGEGLTEVAGQLHLRFEQKSYRFGGFSGFKYRDQGRSMLIPFGLLFETSIGTSAVGAGIKGYGAVTNDTESDRETTLENYFCRNSGCAKKYGAFNPSLLYSELWWRGQFTKTLGFFVAGEYDLAGANNAKGYRVGGGLIYRMPSASRRNQPEDSFQEHLDDTDQSAFAPAMSAPAPPKVPKKKINLQNELNSTEKLIDRPEDQNKENP